MPHLTEYASDLDYPELDRVIQRASAKSRDQRWPDMLSFAQALSQATPTAAHLGLTPLQRSSVNRAMPMATPVPTSGTVPNSTPASLSGLAVPGALADASSTEQTLLKAAERGAVKRAAVAPAATLGPGDQLTGAELTMSQPALPPSSKAPMIAALVVVAALLVGLGLLFAPKAAEPAVVTPKVAVTEPVKVVEPAKVEPAARTADDLAAEVRLTLREETAKANFSRGSAEFEVANFDDATSLLGQIPQESALHDQAQLVLEKIKIIRETLAGAERERGTGHCERATGMYRKVLAINSRVKDAAIGLNLCTQAQVNPTMDP
jgi:serine/threonine-protein kinase